MSFHLKSFDDSKIFFAQYGNDEESGDKHDDPGHP